MNLTNSCHKQRHHLLPQQPPIMIKRMKDTIMRPNSNNNNTDNCWHISSAAERLTILFHARKCSHNHYEYCTIDQCTEAKQMWKHIAQCKDKNCSHCYSSRYVLTHYRECTDHKCQICSPVREEIRRRKELGQQQHHQQIMKTETFSTSMTPSTSTTPRANNNTSHQQQQQHQLPPVSPTTMGGGGGGGGEGTENPMFPTLTVAICRSADNVGRVIPVRRMRSFGSLSTISHGSSINSSSDLSSTRSSSAPGGSSIRSTTASGRTKPYFVKDRENLGIAHFCKDMSIKE